MTAYRDASEQCPRCGVELVDARSARGCEACRGLWVREDVLTEMVVAMLPVPEPGALQFTRGTGPRIPCPSCGEPMAQVGLVGVLVDRCAAHGVWFDADELRDVLLRVPDPAAFGWVSATRDDDPEPEPAPALDPRAPRLRFTLVRGDIIETVELAQQVIKLGRIASAHVRFDDGAGASRLHAVIEATAEAVTLIDLGSDNGTWLNGARVNKAALRDRDRIRIGDTDVTVEIDPRDSYDHLEPGGVSVYRDAFERCPRCGTSLIDAGSARGCRDCRGLWLREDVLTEMVRRMLPEPRLAVLRFTGLLQVTTRLPCPTCGDPMEQYGLGSVPVDRCAEHGVWFDTNELRMVLGRGYSASADPDAPTRLPLVLDQVGPSVVPEPPRIQTPAPTPPTPASVLNSDAFDPTLPRVTFAILRGDTLERVTRQQRRIWIGRSPSAAVRIADEPAAAPLHVAIYVRAPDRIRLVCLVKPRAELNGVELRAATMLESGDTITIGTTYLTVTIDPPPPADAVTP